MFGEDRMILISDAMRATGMDDGTYELGGQPVTKKGRLATLKERNYCRFSNKTFLTV